MKKVLILTIIMMLFTIGKANAICAQCPEIQKQIKKEIKLTKEQKKEIKLIKKDMTKQLKDYKKAFNKNQRKIDKILKADCPDIKLMMDYKYQNASIKKDIITLKKQKYGELLDVYTQEQQETVKRILSENSGMVTKKPCDFCNENPQLRTKCKKCNQKK